MQLKYKISLVASTLLMTSALMAEDYVSVQFVQYDESDNRASISSPSIELSKDFGVDYTLKAAFTADSVSGASPTWYDSVGGASAYSRGINIEESDVAYGPIEYSDNRKAVSGLLTRRFASRDELSVGINYSTEYDYEARELSAEYLHYLNSSKNSSVSFGASYQSNIVDVYDALSGASKQEDVSVISAELGFTQILDAKSLVSVSLFTCIEDGYLTNPYMNVVRDFNPFDTKVNVEEEVKPNKRTSYGTTLRYIRALSNTLSSNTSYRFYSDDWEIQSHTISTELYYELGKDWILGAGLRYYTQSKASFYNSGYFSDELYASSDERMREFDALGYKVSADYKFSKALSANVGLNYYDQKDSFNATYYNVGVKYKF